MKISVDLLKKGMVLQADIYDDLGGLILASGSVINEFLIDKLRDKKIDFVKVIEDQAKLDNVPLITQEERIQGKYNEAVTYFKYMFESFKLGNQVAYKEVENVTSPMVDEVMTNSSIAKQLWKLKDYDQYTFDHSVKVSIISALLSKWLNYSPSLIRRAAVAGLMHDVGKIKIPDEITNKKSPLTDEEEKVMRLHPLFGYNILKDKSNMPDNILDVVLHHHEHYDGSGYPHRISGEKISMLTRIVTIADVYSTMTSHHEYNDMMNPYKVARVLKDAAHSILDPTFTQVFIRGISNYYVGNIVKLTNGDIGEVILINNAEPDKPLVKCEDVFLDLSKERDIEIIEIIY